jgi:hypothetical protein
VKIIQTHLCICRNIWLMGSNEEDTKHLINHCLQDLQYSFIIYICNIQNRLNFCFLAMNCTDSECDKTFIWMNFTKKWIKRASSYYVFPVHLIHFMSGEAKLLKSFLFLRALVYPTFKRWHFITDRTFLPIISHQRAMLKFKNNKQTSDTSKYYGLIVNGTKRLTFKAVVTTLHLL